MSISQQLTRGDKLSLGGGGLCLWAPEYPRWADRLGYWDHAAYLEHAVEPLFTLTLLDEVGRIVPLALSSRTWQPGRLTQHYTTQPGAPDPAAFPAPATSTSASLRVREDKALSPEDVFLSGLHLTNLRPEPQRLTAVLWTAQPRGRDDELEVVTPHPGTPAVPRELVFARSLAARGTLAQLPVAFALGVERVPGSYAVLHSEWSTGHFNHPRWELTSFWDQARVVDGHVRLPNLSRSLGGALGDAANTLLFLALAYPLTLDPSETLSLAFGCALAPTAGEARGHLVQALNASPAKASAAAGPAPGPQLPALRRAEAAWDDYFAALPQFRCSDPYLEKYYYYRYFGLRLNTVDTGGRFNLPRPAVFEGINTGWFRHQISYSAQVLGREARWLPDPALAQGCLENFALAQRADGSFPGAILTGPGASFAPDFMYHGDWGAALCALHAVHPDEAFLQRMYPALLRYAAYYRRQHDGEGSHLYDVRNQAETGQEYMARYQFVDERADQWGPLSPRLKGLDPTIYAYNLFRCLEWLAPTLGQALPPEFTGEADAIASVVREQMWDPEIGFFFDVHPQTGRRSSSKAAVGFYPFLTDIPGPEHLRTLDHLFNPEEFWTPCPVPSTALDDPSASADGEWKDRRMGCPWNGPAWLMTTAHVAQALAHTAQRFQRPDLQRRAADLIARWVRCLYIDGDLARPTSYEYYHPLTGAAPFFRGTDDYMHSWIADLLIQYVAGLQPSTETPTLVVHPLPFDLEHFSLEGARVQGRRVDVHWRQGKGLVVWVDGREAERRPDLGRLEVSLAT